MIGLGCRKFDSCVLQREVGSPFLHQVESRVGIALRQPPVLTSAIATGWTINNHCLNILISRGSQFLRRHVVPIYPQSYLLVTATTLYTSTPPFSSDIRYGDGDSTTQRRLGA